MLTKYLSYQWYCPSVIQSMVTVIIEDIISKLPVESVFMNLEAEKFPGLCSDNPIDEQTVVLKKIPNL